MSDTRSSTTDAMDPQTPPELGGFPLVGNTLSIARDPLEFVDRVHEHGDVVAYEALGTEFVAVFDPDLIEEVLVSRSSEFYKGEFELEFGELVAPEGVAFTEGEQWRRQRTVLQSSFTPEKVRTYTEGMVEEATTLAAEWDDREVVKLREALSAFTVRILTRTLFDLEFDDERAEVVRRATRALSAYANPRKIAIRSILPSWVPSRTERKYDRAMADLSELVTELVAQRRNEGHDGDDLLSLLATAEYPDGTRMASEVVRDQLVTFLFAGHETSATALTFACWLLAGDVETRDRLEDELEAVFGGRDPTFADLPELEYTEAVVREALRLYPPITETYREPFEETTLGNYRIPVGTTLQLSFYGVQRDDRWWDTPEEFRPERWLEDSERPEYAYAPFSGGPRHCLGMRFAMVELQLALATLVSRLEFERVTESISPSVGVTLDPGEIEMRVKKQ